MAAQSPSLEMFSGEGGGNKEKLEIRDIHKNSQNMYEYATIAEVLQKYVFCCLFMDGLID